jgi:hypothetical protein
MKLIERIPSDRQKQISSIIGSRFPLGGLEIWDSIQTLRQGDGNVAENELERIRAIWTSLPIWKSIMFAHIDGAYNGTRENAESILDDDHTGEEDGRADKAISLTPLGYDLLAQLVNDIEVVGDELTRMSALDLKKLYLDERTQGQTNTRSGSASAAADQLPESNAAAQANEPDLDELRSMLAQRDDEIRKLKATVSNLEIEADKTFTTRERNNLLKLLISIAREKYRYDPNKQKNEVHGKLASLMIRHVGKGVTDEIIGKRLKEAARFLIPDDEP